MKIKYIQQLSHTGQTMFKILEYFDFNMYAVIVKYIHEISYNGHTKSKILVYF